MAGHQVYKLQIITPRGTLFSDNVVHVDLPGKNGRFGVLVNHIPAMMSLTIGQVNVQAVGANRYFTIDGGVMEMRDNEMKIVAQAAEDVEQIDVARAKRSRARAQRRLKQTEKYNEARARLSLLRALNRLHAVQSLRTAR